MTLAPEALVEVIPARNVTTFFVLASLFMILTMIFAVARFYTRFAGLKKSTPDDWTVLLALIITTVYFGIVVHMVRMKMYGSHFPTKDSIKDGHVVMHFLANWLPSFAWLFGKSSFFLMYMQIFEPFAWVRWASWAGLVVNCVYYLAIIAATAYFSVPHSGETWVDALHHPRQQSNGSLSVPICIGNLLLDVYIFVLPLLAVSKLKMDTRKKLGVLLVFLTGLGAVISSSVNLSFRVRSLQPENMAQSDYFLVAVLLATINEMTIGIAAACIPSCRYLFLRKKREYLNSIAGTDKERLTGTGDATTP